MIEPDKRTAYIPVQHPFTVDKNRDQHDNVNAGAGIFRELTNYITGRQVLETRGGITEFTHSASAAPITGNRFSGDANCAGLWLFENNLNDTIGGNDLTAVGTVAYTTADVSEGDYAIDFEKTEAAIATIQDSNLDAGFPGKNGVGEIDFSLFGFFKMESFNNQNGLCTKWSSTRSFAVNVMSSSGDAEFKVGYNAGANATTLTLSAGLSIATWYWTCVTYNATTNRMEMYIWNKNTSALMSQGMETAAGNMSPGTSNFTFGRFGAANYYDGLLDEWGMTKDILTTAEMTRIRTGTYRP